MRNLGVKSLVLLAVLTARPIMATDFVVVATTGAIAPSELQPGQQLSAKTRLELEPWGRVLIRETGKCGLTHFVVGVSEYVLTVSEDCAVTAEPKDVSDRLQRGEKFVERLKQTGAGPVDELVSALTNEPCVFLERFSEEGSNVRRCPSGYALRGMRCSGNYCDDKDLICCPYLGGEPDPTIKKMNSRWVSEEIPNSMTSKRFLNGMTCRGPYCDDVFPNQFKSSRLINTKECGWTPWFAEQSAPWLDCGLGAFMAGIRCMGDYCADVAIYCCKAQVE